MESLGCEQFVSENDEQFAGEKNVQVVSGKKHKVNIRNVQPERILPMFFSLLGSLVICAIIAANNHVFTLREKNTASPLVQLRPEDTGSFFLTVTDKATDPVLDFYRNPDFQDWVIDFFTGICSNKEIATAILQNADEFNVPPALAFALSWEESKFNPRAVNRHNRDGSIDRGLFQLNNRSFPHLEINTFFDINVNTRYGLSHLRYCLDTGGTEVSALAIYNAGIGRVNTSGAPRVTLNYISRILDNRRKIESHFHSMVSKEEEVRLVEQESNPTQHPIQINRTLVTASPL